MIMTSTTPRNPPPPVPKATQLLIIALIVIGSLGAYLYGEDASKALTGFQSFPHFIAVIVR